ncbi:MAG: acyltransferase [Thiolinea sp.]
MKIEQLTFTRYLAAMTVVFFHFGMEAFPATIAWIKPVITAGPIAVSYFFVLSGFIMAVAYYAPLLNKPGARFNPRKYWLARFARIYPVYLLALLLMIAANLRGDGSEPFTVLLSLTALQAWIPGYAMTLNSPGWSISVEWFFYLSFPLLLLWVRKRQLTGLLIISLIVWLVTQIVQIVLHNSAAYAPATPLHEFIYYHPLMHINTFVMGFVVGVYFCDGRLDKLRQGWNGPLLALLSLLMILALIYESRIEAALGILIDYNNGLIAPLFLSIIVLLALNRGRVNKLFSLPLLVLLGEASYSLYILQRPVYGIYDRTFGQWLGLDNHMHFYLFALLLTLLSVASFRYLETPLRRMINSYYVSSGKGGQAV